MNEEFYEMSAKNPGRLRPFEQDHILLRDRQLSHRSSSQLNQSKFPQFSLKVVPPENKEYLFKPKHQESQDVGQVKKRMKLHLQSSRELSPKLMSPTKQRALDNLKSLKIKQSSEDNYQKFLHKARMIEYGNDQKKKSPPCDEVKRGKSFSGVFSASYKFGQPKNQFAGQSFKVISGVLPSENNGLKLLNPKRSEIGSKTPFCQKSFVSDWNQGLCLPDNKAAQRFQESADSLLNSDSPSGVRNLHVRSQVIDKVTPLHFEKAIYSFEIMPKEPELELEEPTKKTEKEGSSQFNEMQALYAGVQLIQATWFQSSLPLMGFVAMVGLQQFLKVENQPMIKLKEENTQLKSFEDLKDIQESNETPVQKSVPKEEEKVATLEVINETGDIVLKKCQQVHSPSSQSELSEKHCYKNQMFENISNMMILCKLSQLNGQNTRRKTIGKNICADKYLNFSNLPKSRRRVKLDLIESSKDFFQKLPYFKKQASSSIHANVQRSSPGEIKQENDDESIDSRDYKIHLSPDSSNDHMSYLQKKSFQMSPMAYAHNRDRRCSIAPTLPKSNLFSPVLGEGPLNMFGSSNAEESCKLGCFEMELLELKAYTPYFISQSTVIEYQTQDKGAQPQKLSIMDILQKHFLQKKNLSKFFFKVNMKEDSKKRKSVKISIQNDDDQKLHKKRSTKKEREKMEEIKEEHSVEQNSKHSIKKSCLSKSTDSEKPLLSISNLRKRPGSLNSCRNLVQRDMSYSLSKAQSSHYDSDISLGSDSDATSQTSQCYDDDCVGDLSKHNEENIRYYEFEIKQLKDEATSDSMTFLSIRDITKLIVNHQNSCDMVYQDAIENNYSHEQMTPLNPIMSQASLGKQRFIKLFMEILNLKEGNHPNDLSIERVNYGLLQKIISKRPEAKQVLQQSISIEQSAKAIWYYNTNQIKRMKLMKSQLEINPFTIRDMIPTIWNVIWPFEHYIFKRSINLYLIQKFKIRQQQMITDWYLYEAVLFNIVQNALKYNQSVNGDVVIIQNFKTLKQDLLVSQEKKYILETQIIDSGIGIEPDRQSLLFTPFLELKDRIGIIKAENDNIGLGLACAKEICKKLGGDLKLKQSEKGMTIFVFKIPIIIVQEEQEELKIDNGIIQVQESIDSQDPSNQIMKFKLIGKNKSIFPPIKKYLEENCYLNKQDESQNLGGQDNLIDQFSRIETFPSQKIGFQILEDLNDEQSTLFKHLSKASSKQQCQQAQNGRRIQNKAFGPSLVDDVSSVSQFSSVRGSSILFDQEEEKQPNQPKRGAARFSSKSKIDSNEESSSQSVSIDDNPPSPLQFQNGSESQQNIAIEKKVDPVAKKAVSMSDDQLMNLDSSQKQVFAMNMLSNNQNSEALKRFSGQIPQNYVPQQENQIDFVKDIKLDNLQDSENSDCDDYFVDQALNEQVNKQRQSKRQQGRSVSNREQLSNLSLFPQQQRPNTMSLIPVEQSNVSSKYKAPMGSILSRGDLEQIASPSIRLNSVKKCCPQRILIAEDNEFNMMTVVTILKDINPNFNIVEAQNGKIAVEKFKEGVNKPCKCKDRAFKLVLMDIQMPIKDGIEATKDIIKLKYDQCNIVALTCYTGSEMKKKCLDIGMKAVFNKPVTSDTLRKILEQYFN